MKIPTLSNSILIVIDIQEKLAAAMPPRFLQGNITRASKLVTAADKVNIPTIITEQYPQGLGKTLPIVLDPASPGTETIEKNEFSCWKNDNIRNELEKYQRDVAVLCGLESHICILQTAIDLKSAGYTVWIAADACLSRFSEDHISSMALMRQQGIAVSTFETILFSWIHKAGTPEFKALSFMSQERDH